MYIHTHTYTYTHTGYGNGVGPDGVVRTLRVVWDQRGKNNIADNFTYVSLRYLREILQP